ncbi:outer membrane protein assembly factor BamB [Marinomonas agarivorans]|nr:outer membrane protein assembly factor BamB [Marinomonas agarivorans]
MVKVFLALAISLFILQGCSTYQPLPKPQITSNQIDLRTSWRRGVDGGFGQSSELFNIVVEKNGLYMMTDRGVIYQLNTKDGGKLNSFRLDEFEDNIASGIKKQGDLLLFSTFDGELIAASFKDRQVLWKKALTSEILSAPAVSDGKLAVQTIDGWLTLLDARTGNLLWRTKEDVPALTVRGTSSPIIVDNKVIAGFADGQVKAFSLFNGKNTWSYAVGRPEGKYEIQRLSDVDGRLLLSGSTLFATAYNGSVSAINIATGRAVWQSNIASVLSTALLNDLLIVVDQGSKVIALDAKTGVIKWESTYLIDRDLISPVAFQEHVAVMDRSGYVHVLDGKTGKVLAYKLADKVLPSGSFMVSKDKQLFILTRNEQVTALTF